MLNFGTPYISNTIVFFSAISVFYFLLIFRAQGQKISPGAFYAGCERENSSNAPDEGKTERTYSLS